LLLHYSLKVFEEVRDDSVVLIWCVEVFDKKVLSDGYVDVWFVQLTNAEGRAHLFQDTALECRIFFADFGRDAAEDSEVKCDRTI